MVASSPAQAEAMPSAVGIAVRARTIWVTGSPRTDLLLGREESPAADLRAPARRSCAARRRGRRLVVWAPGDAPGRDRSLRSSGDDLRWLADWADATTPWSACDHRGAAGAARRRAATARRAAAGLLVLSHRMFPDVEMVLREAAALVSDYTAASCSTSWCSDRPVVAYVPDLDEVAEDPGSAARPGRRRARAGRAATGPRCARGWSRLLDALDARAGGRARAAARDRLHAYRDGRSAARVVRRVKETYLPIAEWLAPDA